MRGKAVEQKMKQFLKHLILFSILSLFFACQIVNEAEETSDETNSSSSEDISQYSSDDDNPDSSRDDDQSSSSRGQVETPRESSSSEDEDNPRSSEEDRRSSEEEPDESSSSEEDRRSSEEEPDESSSSEEDRRSSEEEPDESSSSEEEPDESSSSEDSSSSDDEEPQSNLEPCVDEPFMEEALRLLNEARAEGQQCGNTFYDPVGPVEWNDLLEDAALMHSEDMAAGQFLDHTGSDGSRPGDRMTEAGYSWSTYGENIASGQSSVQAAMNAWLNSEGHCKNIMNSSFKEFALACRRNPEARWGGYYWTQVFGTSRTRR